MSAWILPGFVRMTRRRARAATRPGWYAPERQDGSTSAHYRTIVTDLREVAAAFTGFAAGRS
jgi:hypothetical protein